MKQQSRVSKLCYALKKQPMRWTQMQQFIWELNGNKGKVRHGYWSTNIVSLKTKRVIAKNKDGLYILTEQGKLNKDTPYTNNPKKNKKILQEDCKRAIERGNELVGKNCSLWNENRRLKDENWRLKEAIDSLVEAYNEIAQQDFQINRRTYG